MAKLLHAADFIMEEATRAGIRDRVGLVIGSDFGRTPKYNAGNGKDHWPITSMMMMGAGIRGNRVIGATDEERRPVTVDPANPCLLYTSPSPRDGLLSRMPSSA